MEKKCYGRFSQVHQTAATTGFENYKDYIVAEEELIANTPPKHEYVCYALKHFLVQSICRKQAEQTHVGHIGSPSYVKV